MCTCKWSRYGKVNYTTWNDVNMSPCIYLYTGFILNWLIHINLYLEHCEKDSYISDRDMVVEIAQ